MNTQSQYTVVHICEVNKICELLDQGWTLAGGPFVNNHSLCQALYIHVNVKESEKPFTAEDAIELASRRILVIADQLVKQATEAARQAALNGSFRSDIKLDRNLPKASVLRAADILRKDPYWYHVAISQDYMFIKAKGKPKDMECGYEPVGNVGATEKVHGKE